MITNINPATAADRGLVDWWICWSASEDEALHTDFGKLAENVLAELTRRGVRACWPEGFALDPDALIVTSKYLWGDLREIASHLDYDVEQMLAAGFPQYETIVAGIPAWNYGEVVAWFNNVRASLSAAQKGQVH